MPCPCMLSFRMNRLLWLPRCHIGVLSDASSAGLQRYRSCNRATEGRARFPSAERMPSARASLIEKMARGGRRSLSFRVAPDRARNRGPHPTTPAGRPDCCQVRSTDSSHRTWPACPLWMVRSLPSVVRTAIALTVLPRTPVIAAPVKTSAPAFPNLSDQRGLRLRPCIDDGCGRRRRRRANRRPVVQPLSHVVKTVGATSGGDRKTDWRRCWRRMPS